MTHCEKVDIQCPFCEGNNVYLYTKKDWFKLNNKFVEYQNKFFKCRMCGEEFYNGKLLNENLTKIKKESEGNND